MEKSTTGKRVDLERAQDLFAEFGTKYLRHWTKEQLKNYINKPVVIPVGNYGFFVGPYTIIGRTKNCWTVEQADGRHIHDFVTKANAILYCLKSMSNRADYHEILELDRQLGKLDNDIVFYKNILANTKNNFKNTITLNRYIDANLQRRAVLNILKKTLISAKYFNFGKLPL
jgi:hypothetical protein